MAVLVRSAMNPNGTWQQDGLDQEAQSNRAYQTQMQGRDLQAQLALAQLGNQKYGMDQTAAMTREGWGREDSRRSSEYDKAIALARIGKEPNAIEQARFDRDNKFDDMIMGAFGGQGVAAPAAGGAPAMGGGMSQDRLRELSVLSSLRNRTAMPDFGAQDLQKEMSQMMLADRKKNTARDDIRFAMEAGDATGARRISGETGEAMPRVDVNTLGAEPAIAGGIDSLMREGDAVASKSYFGAGDASTSNITEQSQLDELMSAAVTQLVNRGASPEDARAFVIQKIREKFGNADGGLGIDGVYKQGGDVIREYSKGLK